MTRVVWPPTCGQSTDVALVQKRLPGLGIDVSPVCFTFLVTSKTCVWNNDVKPVAFCRSGRLELVRERCIREEAPATAVHVRSQRLCKPREGHLQVRHGADSRIDCRGRPGTNIYCPTVGVCRNCLTCVVVSSHAGHSWRTALERYHCISWPV